MTPILRSHSRSGVLLGGLLWALGNLLGAPAVQADHGGPIVFVDIKNPPEADEDCDAHFRTLRAALENCALPEHAIVIVDPGVYDEGRLVVSVKGLVVQSSGGAQRTKINGCFVLEAKQVELRGFDVNAKDQQDCENAVTIANREVIVTDNIIREAAAHGIEVAEASDNVTLTRNQLFNNGGIGIRVLGESQGLQIARNRVQSNGASGIVLEGNADRFTISENEVRLNLGTGVLVLGADGGQITNNTIASNGLEGLKLDKANNNVIVNNEIVSNGLFGVALVGSDNNEVRSNALTGNRAGGVALRGNAVPAQRNTVESNTISESTQSGASGILLEGDVTGSIILKNTIVRNSIGVRLTRSDVTEGEPSNNTLDSNEIRENDADGIRIEASFGLNFFRSNRIAANNGIGVHVRGGMGNDTFAENIIEDNGDDGIRVVDSPRNTLEGNEITGNGGGDNSGGLTDGGAIVLLRADSTVVRRNLLHDGEANGLLILESKNVKVMENTVERHQQDGLKGQQLEGLFVEGNLFRANRERGLAIRGCRRPDFQGNVVTQNGLGGIFLADCEGANLQRNDITENLRFGLWAENVPDLSARRNWWGDPKGPAGVYEGSGNAVVLIGVRGGNSFPLEQDEVVRILLPWLTDRVGQLHERSVRGFVLADFGPGKVELDAMDRTDVRISLFRVGKEARGIAIVAKYATALPAEDSIYRPAPLANALKTIGVLINGFGTGTALLEVTYADEELPEGVIKEALRLFYWDGSAWVPLPGKSLQGVNLVEGEIDVSRLRAGAIIALAPQAP